MKISKLYIESGASKRKRKVEQEALHSKQRGDILNFVTRRPLLHLAALTLGCLCLILNEEETQSTSQSLTSGQSSQMALEDVVEKSANLQEAVK